MGSPRIRAAILLGSLMLMGFGYALVAGTPLHEDEWGHLSQIRLFERGRFELFVVPGEEAPRNAMIPGYHALMAGFAKLAGTQPDVLRLFNLGLSLLLALVLYRVARALDAGSAALRTAQCLCFPLLYPLFSLIYTDVLSLLLLLASLLACLRRHLWLAGLLGLACLSVRQNNIVYLAFLFAFVYVEDNGYAFDLARVRRHLVRSAGLVLAAACFAIFVLVWRQVGLADPRFQRLAPNLGNVAFSLFCCCVLLLPFHISQLRRIAGFVRRHPIWVLALAAAIALFAWNWIPEHPWNRRPELLRNHVLRFLVNHDGGRALLGASILWALLSLTVARLRPPGAYLLYPAWLASVLPVLLIEPRYYLQAFVLLLLFREERSPAVEIALFATFATTSVALHWEHVRGALFL